MSNHPISPTPPLSPTHSSHSGSGSDDGAPEIYCCAPLISSISSCCGEEAADHVNWFFTTVGDFVTETLSDALYFWQWLLGNTPMQIGERILHTWSTREIPAHAAAEYAAVHAEWCHMLDVMPDAMRDYVINTFEEEQRHRIHLPKGPQAKSGPAEGWSEAELAAIQAAMREDAGDIAVLQYVSEWMDREKCSDLSDLEKAKWVYKRWHEREIPDETARNYKIVQNEWLNNLDTLLPGSAYREVLFAFIDHYGSEVEWPKTTFNPDDGYNDEEQEAIDWAMKNRPSDPICLKALSIWIALKPTRDADLHAIAGQEPAGIAAWFCNKWQDYEVPHADDPHFSVVSSDWIHNIFELLTPAFRTHASSAFAREYEADIAWPAPSEGAIAQKERDEAVRRALVTRPADPIFIQAVRERHGVSTIRESARKETATLSPQFVAYWFYGKWQGRKANLADSVEWWVHIVDILPRDARDFAWQKFADQHDTEFSRELQQNEWRRAIDNLLKAHVGDQVFVAAVGDWATKKPVDDLEL